MLAAVRRIASSDYRDPQIAKREWDAMWRRVWLLAAHHSQLPEAGCFRRFDLGRESVLLVRQQGGSLRAFHNVCVHRGTRLCMEAQGRREHFRCPYHGWRYGRDGALLSTHAPDSFEPNELSLRELVCEERFGFCWVSFARAPEPIDEYLRGIAPIIAPYLPEQWQLRSDVSTTLACNWKTSRDAHNETVHVHALHPEVLALMDDRQAQVSLLGAHGHIAVPFGLPSTRLMSGEQPLPETFLQWARSLDVEINPADLRADRSDALLARLRRAARTRSEAQGVPVTTLSDAQLLDTHQLFIFPNVQLNMRAEEVLLFRHRPHPDDPQQMHFDQLSFARAGTASTERAAPAHEWVEPSASVFGGVTGADLEMVARQQLGLGSSGLESWTLGPGEELIEGSQRTLERYLRGDEEQLTRLYLAFTFDMVAQGPLEHLHWGYWADVPHEPRKLPDAQRAYAETLLEMIPPAAERVLDVGCGLGGIAHMLHGAGKQVHAISPRADHCALLRQAAPDIEVSCTRFEELPVERRYDLLLFAESFNFFVSDRRRPAAAAVSAWLDRCRPLLAPAGRILIADVIGDEILAALRAAPEIELFDERDITDAVAFTGEALQWHIERYVVPYQKLLNGVLERQNPTLSDDLAATLASLDQQALQALFRGEMVELSMARDHRYRIMTMAMRS